MSGQWAVSGQVIEHYSLYDRWYESIIRHQCKETSILLIMVLLSHYSPEHNSINSDLGLSEPGLEKTRVFFNKTQPGGVFWVLLGFWGFIGVFWVFWVLLSLDMLSLNIKFS